MAGIAQQLVVDRGEEHLRRLLGRSRREGEQRGRVEDELAELPVQRRLGAAMRPKVRKWASVARSMGWHARAVRRVALLCLLALAGCGGDERELGEAG